MHRNPLACRSFLGSFGARARLLIIATICWPVLALGFIVEGVVSTDAEPVRYALVTFTNASDTSIHYSALTDTSGYYRIDVLVSIAPPINLPQSFELEQNYPNPFSSSTSIPYRLNTMSDVQVTIYDLLGREVRKLTMGIQPPGEYGLVWDGTNSYGERIAAGIYFVRLHNGAEIQVKKMVVVGEAATLGVGPPGTVIYQADQIQSYQTNTQKLIKVLSGNYTISVTNADSTRPHIFSAHIDDMPIQNDTTLNFNVKRYGTWTKLEAGVSSRLNDIDFIDDQNGWAVGDDGAILHTTNGGDFWQQQTFPADELPGFNDYEDILWAVDFIDHTNGWICSRNSIFKTTNGGESWEIKHSQNLEDGRFHDIELLNAEIGFAVGGDWWSADCILLKTVDGGESWEDVTPQNSLTLTDISIVDQRMIWICGIGGTYLFSADSGSTWIMQELDIIPAPIFTSIQFIDEKIGWLGADHNSDYNTRFLRTTDGGNTWILTSREAWSYYLFGVCTLHFADSLNGWVGTMFMGSGAIAQTADGGRTWEFLPEEINHGDLATVSDIVGMCFITKDLGWAVGIHPVDAKPAGVILRYERNQ